MNPFSKSSSGYAASVVDRANKHLEKAKKENEERQKQEQEAAQAEVDAQAAQQQQQQDQEKQQQQQEKQMQLDQHKKTLALSNAANTPSFKPYTIKSAAKIPGLRDAGRWIGNAVRGVGNAAGSARKLISENPGAAAAGLGNAGVWDYYIYGPGAGRDFKEYLTDWDRTRALGTLFAGTSGVMTPAAVRAAPAGLPSKTKAGLMMAGGLPFVERAGMLSMFDAYPRFRQNQQLKAEKLKAETNRLNQQAEAVDTPAAGIGSGTQDISTDVPWKTLLALGAVGTGVYAYDKLFKDTPEQSETVSDARNPDRLALEIPSHKISDSFYNRLGREILFKDKEEEEREKEASVKKAETTLSSQEAYDNIPNYNNYVKWRTDQYDSPRPWAGTAETFLPFVGAAFGVPMGTATQNLTKHITPVESPSNNQNVNSGWAKTLNLIRNGANRPKWSPGRTVNLQPGASA